MNNKTPLIVIKNLVRDFMAGDSTVRILHGIDLSLYQGEMVAIIGQSGSGKSTLMNILGCLDKPTSGSYQIYGQDVGQMDTEQLAKLRREHFGFIFQRYHLLGDINALDNVTVPAVYAGVDSAKRVARAGELLTALGLGDKLYNRPNQLSGGQQQRVSIARALMNGGDIILADEPTGALDSRSGKEVMQILYDLRDKGHTIIMVTHDPNLAKTAERVIELKDGQIIADYYTADNANQSADLQNVANVGHHNDEVPNTNANTNSNANQNTNAIVNTTNKKLTKKAQKKLAKKQKEKIQNLPNVNNDESLKNNHQNNHTGAIVFNQNVMDNPPIQTNAHLQKSRPTPQKIIDSTTKGAAASFFDCLAESFKMSLYAMKAHKMRTLLTMLGIIIGIASVVSVVGLGQGSQAKILAGINALGTNTITVMNGYPFGDPRRKFGYDNLTIADSEAIASQPYAVSVSPQVDKNITARYKNVESTASVNGVGKDYLTVTGEKLAMGQGFSDESIRGLTQDIILDQNAYQTFFEGKGNPVGEIMMLGETPAQVVGVLAKKERSFGRVNNTPQLYMPYTTVMSRMVGTTYLDRFVVLIDESTPSDIAENAIRKLMTERHGTDDFNIMNTDSIRQTVESTTATMTLLIASIAIISLIVGGIGVMNIMLVSVTERTSEIGVRMAVGARQSDILQQFLIEAVLVCLIGGVLGIGLAFLVGETINRFAKDFSVMYSPLSIVMAFLCATVIGIVFGFLPAKNASALDPVDALNRN